MDIPVTYNLQPPDPTDPPSSNGALSKRYELSAVERGLEQFFVRLKLIHRWSPDPDGDEIGRWADLISLMPTVPPGHFRELAGDLVPETQIRYIEKLLSRFRRLKADVVNGLDVTEIGPEALDTLRQLSVAVGTHRFTNGEQFVVAAKMTRDLPADTLDGLSLIQVLLGSDTLADETFVRTSELIYLLPFDPATVTTAERWHDRWHEHARRIERHFVTLFPGWHASVELRDKDGVTMARRTTVGPGCERDQ